MIECPACRKNFTAPLAASIPYRCPHCASHVLGAYCDLELIGDGSMGKVYRARRPDMRDQRVAVKIPKTSDVQSRERFNREIAASATLRHENIVRAFDCGEMDGQLFLVMDLEEGQILNELVRCEGQLACRTVGGIVCDVAKGLVHANVHDIVNRDIKPENILISTAGQAKILDFGLAIVAGTAGAADRTTVPGTLLGTVAFMAPEQARDPRDVTIAADIYSLGCTAYYALTGRPPFSGSRDRIVEQHATAPRPVVAEVRADVPPVFSALIGRMMAIMAADRPTAAAVVAELSSYLPHLPNEIAGSNAVAVLEGELVEEGEALDETANFEPRRGGPFAEKLGEVGTAVDFDTLTHPIPPLPDTQPWGADPLGEMIEEGEVIEEIPLDRLVNAGPLPLGTAVGTEAPAKPGPRQKTTKSTHHKSRRKMMLVTAAAAVLMLGVVGVTKLLIAPPNPQAVWEEIQEEYQLHKWKLVETQLAEFASEHPQDPHCAEVPFFLAMCEAGRDVHSQTGDAARGLTRIEQVFQEFRDTQEYDKYNSDLFQDLQRLIERFVEQTNKSSQPESLVSAEKAHELLSTVAQSMTEDWVEAKVSGLDDSIRQARNQLAIALAKQEVLDMLGAASSADSTADSTDKTYEAAKGVLEHHPLLQGDEEILAAFGAAYANEVTRVTYEPFVDDADVTLPAAPATGDQTIFVVWDQPSEAGPAAGDGVFLALADGVLYAFDDAGTNLWSHRLGVDSHRLPVSLKPSPTSPDAVIAISSIDNSLIAIAAKTGRILWRYHPDSEQDLAASLTISQWRPALNKPPRIRGLIPTESGEIHVLELVRGRRMGRFQTNVPLTVGGVFDPVTQLLFFPADSKRVFAIDPAVIESQDTASNAVRSVLLTNHLSGSLRAQPQVIGQYLLLTELLDLENTQLRVFELHDPTGFAKPNAEPVKKRILHGWSWFTPPLTPDRMTLVTDAGELGVFGLNLDNPDEALYPLIHDGKGNCPTLAINDPYRAMAIHSDENLLWLMAGGTLRKMALDVLAQKVTTLWPEDQAKGADEGASEAQVVGLPLHEATFDREAERIYVTARSPDSSHAEFISVDANTGDRLWSRQLGIHAMGDPVVSGNDAILIDRSGRMLQLSLNEAEDGTLRVRRIADDMPPAGSSAGELMRLRDVEGKEYLALPTAAGQAIAIRAIDPSQPLLSTWKTLPLAATRLQGRPAVLDGYLLVPCADGRLQRIPLDDLTLRSPNEQTFQWALENSVASDDSPAVYPLAPGRILLAHRQRLRWLEYVRSNGVEYWKEQSETLIEAPGSGELAFAGEYIFMAGEKNSLSRVRRDGQGEPETWQLEGRPTAGPVAIKDQIFVVLDGHKLALFSPSSATARWSLGPLAGRVAGWPVIAGKSLFVTDDSGTVTKVGLDTGKNTVMHLPPGAIPVAAAVPFGRDRVLAPLADGTLAWYQIPPAEMSSRQQGVRR